MRLTTKLFSVFILMLLATPVFLFNACGVATNDSCGGCPNSVAPAGSTITATASGTEWEVTADPALTSYVQLCTSSITFVVKDENGDELDNICVELFTDGYIALVDPENPGSCTTNPNYVQNYIRHRTDSSGAITVDFATSIISAPTSTSVTESEVGNFVTAKSCSAESEVPISTTVTWQWE